MITKKYMILLLSFIMLAFYACSEDSVSVVDLPPEQPEPEQPQPEEPELDAELFGSWVLDPTAGSLGVGPAVGNYEWWSISADDVATRGCLYDDLFIFNEDGSFEMDMGGETWLETWQGVDADGCGAPVAPHDGSTVGEWSVSDGSLTVVGEGLFLGLAKVHNTAEDGKPENNTITYNYELSEGGSILEVTITGFNPDAPDAAWYFRFTNDTESGEPEVEAPITGTWVLDPTPGSLGVGPAIGDYSWWSIDAAGVEDRACFYDDLYIFNADGTFQNDMGDETWLETWQGVDADGCGAPVAPHDGSSAGEWTLGNETVTLVGEGVFLGLAKVHNTGEDGRPENNTIVYNFELSDDDNLLEITITGFHEDPNAAWYYRFKRDE